MAAPLQEQFNKATKLIGSLPKDGPLHADNKTKLKYYSFYKQATQGKAPGTAPSSLDITAKSKWDAWSAVGDMSKEEAMQNYVDLVAQNLTDPEPGVYPEVEKNLQDFRKAIGK